MSHDYIHGDFLASYRGWVSLAQAAFGVMRMIAVLAQGGKNGERYGSALGGWISVGADLASVGGLPGRYRGHANLRRR